MSEKSAYQSECERKCIYCAAGERQGRMSEMGIHEPKLVHWIPKGNKPCTAPTPLAFAEELAEKVATFEQMLAIGFAGAGNEVPGPNVLSVHFDPESGAWVGQWFGVLSAGSTREEAIVATVSAVVMQRNAESDRFEAETAMLVAKVVELEASAEYIRERELRPLWKVVTDIVWTEDPTQLIGMGGEYARALREVVDAMKQRLADCERMGKTPHLRERSSSLATETDEQSANKEAADSDSSA